MEITVTRALSEVKTLKDRIYKLTHELTICGIVKNDTKKINDRYTEKEFSDTAKKRYDELNSYINRLMNLKTAISKFNSETKIIINGEEITVEEALIKKAYIDVKVDMLNRLKSTSLSIRNQLSNINAKAETDVDNMFKDFNGDKESLKKTRLDVLSTKQSTFFDPLNIDKIIEKLDNEITSFMTEIDYVLSEVNSSNKINVD